ncbi:MAG TPA: hypothetical protein VEK08_26580 [Planctomycetota bacterium]|nr:hypothetical protein [Planctomycetota bacterium]
MISVLPRIVLAGLCVFQAIPGFAGEKDSVWVGIVRTARMEKGPPGLQHPFLQNEINRWLLKGDAVAPVEACSKGRFWVVRGSLSDDKKTILVSEMKERTEWSGEVRTTREGKYAPLRPFVVLGKSERFLTGPGVAHAQEFLQRRRWKITGKESDDAKSIEVSAMEKVDDQK